jgi:hypothetical protein
MSSAKFTPYFCIGCGVDVTYEPWPHLDRGLLTPEQADYAATPKRPRPKPAKPAKPMERP